MSDSFPHTRPLVPMPLSIWLFPNYPCMHAKSLQLCLTLCDPMDCGPLSSSVHPRDSPGKNTGMGCHALLQGIFLTQGSNLHLLMSPVLAGGFFTTSTTWKACSWVISFNKNPKTSLVVQWLRMSWTWVQSLIWEDPACLRAIRPVCLKSRSPSA